VRRTLLVGNHPVAYLEDFVLSDILPAEEVDDSFIGSVLDLLVQRRFPHVQEGLVEITALSVDDSLALRLGTQAGRAILLLEETLFDDKRTPIGFSYNYFVPDRFRFWLVRSRNPSEE
jgi:GntR family transcriptional regulator